MIRIFLGIVLSTAIGATEGAGEADAPSQAPAVRHEPFSLAELIELAQQSSPNLREALAKIESARGKAIQAGLYPNPRVQGGAMQLAGSDSQYFAQVSQEIVTKAKLKLEQAAASQEVSQEELTYVRTRFDLLTAVRKQFASTLAAQRRVEVSKMLVELAGKSSESARRLERAGEGTPADSLLLEIEEERAKVALENAQAKLEASRRQLAAVIGQPGLAIAELSGDLSAGPTFLAPTDELVPLVAENADVRSAQVEIDRQKVLLRRAEVEPFPNVMISAGYMYSVTPLNNMTILMLEVPIPVWNRNQGAIIATRARIGQAVQAASRKQNELIASLAAAVGDYRAASQQIAKYEREILPKARRTVDLFQKGLAQGQFDLLRLLAAQRSLVDVDLALVGSFEARWLAAAEIAGILQVEEFP